MKMTLEEIKNMLPYILKHHEPEKIKLSEEAKKYDLLEQARIRAKKLIEKIKRL